jgi:hypothetical protein
MLFAPRLIAVIGGSAIAVLLAGGVASAQPDIRSIVTPAPNPRGWNNTPVTVSFVCTGTASCPGPVILNDNGAWQNVTRAVVDAQGARAEATAIVNIDMLAPTLSLIDPTADRATTEAAVSVAATAQDALSGVVAATCNGEPARLSGGHITCSRSLPAGSSDVIVNAIDAAGNSATTAVRIWREAAPRDIRIVPQTITIGLNFREILQVLDDSGRHLFDPVCTSADPAVARVLENAAPCTIKGIGAGQTVVTATVGRMSATVAITVLDGPKAPLGRTLSTLPPSPGFTIDQRVQPVNEPGGPAVMLVEMSDAGAPYRIKAITREPRVLWYEWPAIATHEHIVQWMGDTTGGGLLLLEGDDARPSAAIVRIGRPRKGTLWRYESSGRLSASWAMNWEGTLFIVETPRDGFPQIVGIDSITGRTLFRLPVPRAGDTPPIIGEATVPDKDGAAFAFMQVENDDTATRYALKLMRVYADGQSIVQTESTLPDFRDLALWW